MNSPARVRTSEQAKKQSAWTPRSFWIFQGLFWFISTIAIAFVTITLVPIPHVSEVVAGRVATGFLLTLGLHTVYEKPWLQRLPGPQKWASVLLLNGAAIVGSSLVWLMLIEHGVLRELTNENLFFYLCGSRFFGLLSWHSCYYSIDFWRRTIALREAALEADLAVREAELRQLQSQLNPHFLFNALNTIKCGAHDPGLTRQVTQDLADYLRFSLAPSRPLNPLSREIDHLAPFISIQRARFGDSLDCRMDVLPEALDLLVPPMLLQPLLENAFKFGGETSPRPLRITVATRVENGRLLVTVTNTGSWVTRPLTPSTGIGLANLRRRLELLYGGEAALVTRPAERRVSVEVSLPARAETA